MGRGLIFLSFSLFVCLLRLFFYIFFIFSFLIELLFWCSTIEPILNDGGTLRQSRLSLLHYSCGGDREFTQYRCL